MADYVNDLFEWDEAKSESNRIDHGLTFFSVYQFDWENASTFESDRCGEKRRTSFGMIGRSLYVVVWTERGTRQRIISLHRTSIEDLRRHESKT